MTARTDDPLERLLATALRDARTDDRWAVPAAPGLAHRVRRATTRRQRQRALLAATAGLAVVSAATAGLAQLGGGAPDTDRVFAESAPPPAASPLAGPSPAPVPGISPDFTPTHGRDWLLTDEDFARFTETHTTPSPRPNPVQSPAPLTDYSARLLAEVEAGLPEGSVTERQDALNGDPATAGIHVILPDGTPVEVAREPFQTPIPVEQWYQSTGGPQVDDVPGSDSVVVSLAEVGYGWGPGIEDGARSVTVVRRDGEATRWQAPLSVPLETVTQWALAAEAAGR